MERRKPLIAVVDDETVFLDLMADILTEEGYRTIVWKEAQGAHAYVRDQQPDLVILDIRLEKPEAGWNILELLRLDAATRNNPRGRLLGRRSVSQGESCTAPGKGLFCIRKAI